MGHPNKQRKKYESPGKPYDKTRIEKEKRVNENFGLRRKKEIRRAESMLRQFRRRARELQARRNEKEEAILLATVNNMGIKCQNLENVLEISLDDMLSRRLQTIIQKKGLANTMRHARQLVTHGHISVGGKRILYPGYIVGAGEEEKITLSPAIKLQAEEKKNE